MAESGVRELIRLHKLEKGRYIIAEAHSPQTSFRLAIESGNTWMTCTAIILSVPCWPLRCNFEYVHFSTMVKIVPS